MKPLQGIKIIDFTRLLPGPLATHLLAQMGAEVIKIESPKRKDYTRTSGPMTDEASMLFHQLNHNKTLRTLDYNAPEGKAEVLQLLKGAHALIEQFRPGAMDAWGLGYEAVKAVNSKIAYVSITGYGQQGAYHQQPGHDLNYLALAGILEFLQDAKGKPIVPDTQIADIGGAYMAVIALQGALLQQSRTGQGSWVDVSLCDAVSPFLAVPFALHQSGLDHRQFNLVNGKTTVNYAVYECADGKWVSLAAMEVKFWNNFCERVGKQAWKRNNPFELTVAAFPKSEVEALFQTRTRDEWVNLLAGHDVCLTPVLHLQELESHPYHQEKGTFMPQQTANEKLFKTIRLPFEDISPPQA